MGFQVSGTINVFGFEYGVVISVRVEAKCFQVFSVEMDSGEVRAVRVEVLEVFVKVLHGVYSVH